MPPGLAAIGGSEDITVSVCHVTLQGNIIKKLNEVMVRTSSTYVTILCGYRHFGNRNIIV